MKMKLTALFLGLALATTGIVSISAKASESDISASYDIQNIEVVSDPEMEAKRLKAATKFGKKVVDEVKNWAFWDAVFGSENIVEHGTIDSKDAEVIFDK